VVLLAVVTLVTTTAAAQPRPSEAFTRAYQAGVDSFRLGKYDEARKHLIAARELEPDLPGPHRFLAAVAAAENEWDECVASARAAIAANPQSAEIGATRKLHDDCRAALGRTPFTGEYADGGAIAVTANVGGASVTIAGLKYGATPMAPRAIALGRVEVVVQKSGWKDARGEAVILPGIVTDLELTLEEDDAGPAQGPLDQPAPIAELGWLRVTAPPGAAVLIDGEPRPLDARGRYALTPRVYEIDVASPDHYPARRTVRVSRGQEVTVEVDLPSKAGVDRRRRFGHVAIATAVAFGATGVVTGLLASRAEDRARDLWVIETTRPPLVPLEESAAIEPVHTRAEIEAKVDRARTLGLVSNLGYGVAAVSLGVGVYLLARTPDRPPATTVAPMVPAGEAQAWGIAVGGRL